MLLKTIKYLRWTYTKRHLISVITKTQLKQSISNTKLSYLWWLLDPTMNFLCFVFLVAVLHRGGHGGRYHIPYPLHIISALFPWYFTKKCISASANTWGSYRGIISQIRFPYLTLILSNLFSELVLFCTGFLIIFGICLIYGYHPRITWLLIPAVMVLHAISLTGLMLINAVLSFLILDYKKLLPFLMRFWFYLSPALWSITMLPARFQKLILLNPMSILFTDYRQLLLFGKIPDLKLNCIYLLCSLVLLLTGLIIFVRKEPYINRYI